MNYEPIIRKINYWKGYKGSGDTYRKTHEMDCLLTNGNLFADTIFSLWLPLRYSLNYFGSSRWSEWKEYEFAVLKAKRVGLKDCDDFLEDLAANIEMYLPENVLTERLAELFHIGQTRANVIILPYRSWNTVRGAQPYWDYLPHYLSHLLNTENKAFLAAVIRWIEDEKLTVFFENEIIDTEHIRDLAGTGSIYSHSPKQINILVLIENYIKILQERRKAMRHRG